MDASANDTVDDTSLASQEQEAALESKEQELTEQRRDLERQQKKLRDDAAASRADNKASAAALEDERAQLQVRAGQIVASLRCHQIPSLYFAAPLPVSSRPMWHQILCIGGWNQGMSALALTLALAYQQLPV